MKRDRESVPYCKAFCKVCVLRDRERGVCREIERVYAER